jgi:hypothetical protein
MQAESEMQIGVRQTKRLETKNRFLRFSLRGPQLVDGRSEGPKRKGPTLFSTVAL